MRKDFGPQTWVYPMPVLIIGTYNEDGTPNAMNAAWGGTWDYNKIFISLSPHATTNNILKNKEFTVSFADSKHVVEADYVGIVSAKQEKDKIKKSGLTPKKSNFVNAPTFEEFPLTLECKLVSGENGNIIGEIVNVSADEKVLNETGKIDAQKLHIITFDPAGNTYIELGAKVGNAFKDGLKIKNK